MPACEGTVFVITAGGVATIVAVLTALGGALAGGYSVLFYQTIKGRDNHIAYMQGVNADLTDIARPALGVARGAVDEVRDRRKQAGRQGT